MFEQLLAEYFWFGLLLWSLVYFSDYYLTIYTARLYRARAKEFIVYEGSFELTPYFQADVDCLRKISPRFLLSLTLYLVWISAVWYLAVATFQFPPLYSWAMGALLLLEVAVLHRHLQNILVFRMARKRQCISGQITYTRWFILRRSAGDLLGFAALFLLLSLVTESWFVFGGSVTCFSTGLKHWRLSRRQVVPGLAQPIPPPLESK